MENHRLVINTDETKSTQVKRKKGENGFSLIEVVIALVILLVAVLGIFAAFTFATTLNTGNSSRSQALSVLQEEVELLRAAKFTPTVTDSYPPSSPDNGQRDITGGTKALKTITSKGDGGKYTILTVVDNDPVMTGVQDEVTRPNPPMKEITLTVTSQSIRGNWVIAYPTKVVFRRVRAN
jgi:prepilin-type N-terminal cleavage/methylation domain-containing protein